MEDSAEYFLNQEEPNRSCLLALRDVILGHDERIYETRKYGMPCYCVGKKAICYLWVDKKTKEPYILMVDGNLLQHPGLEAGSRSRMKIFRVNPEADLPIESIHELLSEALLQSGGKIPRRG